MNERLTQLAKQAQVEHCISHVRLQQFAELIVRECADVGYDASYNECALNVSNKIKEHFGVDID